MLKIQRSSNDGVVFTLVGRMETEHVAELQQLLLQEDVSRGIALNLQDVTLIDRDGVKFLAHCEQDHIRLEDCTGFIRVWINRERRHN